MKTQTKYLPFAIVAVVILNVLSLSAQTSELLQTTLTPAAKNQETPTPIISPNSNPTEVLALEIGQLRKSLQTLNARLREWSEKLAVPETKIRAEPNVKQNRVLLNLEILSRAEQRAEILRKQFIELIEKENAVKTRLIQMEEDLRPENIERGLNGTGSTRAPEMRDNRRRVLETERNGLQIIQNQIYQSRTRLEEDVRQADSLVVAMRRIVFPAIQKEIQNSVSESN